MSSNKHHRKSRKSLSPMKNKSSRSRSRSKSKSRHEKKEIDFSVPLPTFDVLKSNSDSDSSDDDDNDRYELWSFRIPASIPLESLNDVELVIPKDNNSKTTGSKHIEDMKNNDCSFKVNEKEYMFRFNNNDGRKDNETFRVLVDGSKKKQNDNEDDDNMDHDDNDQEAKKPTPSTTKFLTPHKKEFEQNIDVIECTDMDLLTQQFLAPQKHTKPISAVIPKPMNLKSSLLVSSAQKMIMKHAYTPIPQKVGLKRRFQPLGCSSSNNNESATTSAAVTMPKRRKPNETTKTIIKKEESGAKKVDATPNGSEQQDHNNKSSMDIDTPASMKSENEVGHETPMSTSATKKEKHHSKSSSSTHDDKKEKKKRKKEEKKAKKEAKKAAKKEKKEAKKSKSS